MTAPPRQLSPLVWVALAAAALLLPAAGAGTFVALRWSAGPGGSARQGTLHAGIEIGSKGVKAVVIEVFPHPEFGYDVDPRPPKTVNTTLVAGLASSDHFDPAALQDTARAVAKLYKEVLSEHKVPEGHIYVVGSSGLFAPLRKRKNLAEAKKAELIQGNKDKLSQAVQEAVGKPVRFIDAADEAERSFKGIVPRPRRGESALYDVGSGNTKAAYAAGPDTFVTFELPYATRSYADFVRKECGKTGTPFRDGVRRLSEAALRQPLREQYGRKQGFLNREYVYLSGGVVWALANHVHPENRRAMVELTAADLDSFEAMLDQDRRAVVEQCLARVGPDEATRKEVEKELRRVHDEFSPDELRAGAAVLRAVWEEGGFAGKKLFFARHGYFGWLLSYVGEKGAE